MEESQHKGINREERRGGRGWQQPRHLASLTWLHAVNPALPSHDREASRTWWFHTETLSILGPIAFLVFFLINILALCVEIGPTAQVLSAF